MRIGKQNKLFLRFIACIACICLFIESLFSYDVLTAYATSLETSFSGASTASEVTDVFGTASNSDTTVTSVAPTASEGNSNETIPAPSTPAETFNEGTHSSTESAQSPANTLITIDDTTFPDSAFSNFIYENIDSNSDKLLSAEEINAVTTLDVSHLGIASLKGIEYFTDLLELDCSNNQLTGLDLSALIKLTTLNCSWNHLMNLDLSTNSNLTKLECSGNAVPVLINDTNQIDLSQFTDFNIAQTKNWSCNYNIAENILALDNPDNISVITYETSNLYPLTLENPVIFSLVLYKTDLEPVEVNETNFPDAELMKFISVSYDKDQNQILDSIELLNITTMDISKSNIKDLTGIQFFTNLTYFNYNSTQPENINLNLVPATTTLYCDGLPVLKETDTSNQDTAKNTTVSDTTENTLPADTTTTDQPIPAETQTTTSLPATTSGITYTISFDSVGGSTVDAIVVYENTVVDGTIVTAIPTKTGCTFDGWYLDNTYVTRFSSISPGLTQNITLFAKWNQLTVNTTGITSVINSGKGKLSITYNEISGVAGYEVLCSTSKKFDSNIRTTTTSSTNITVKSLIKNKTYYVKIRGFLIDSTGSKVYGEYSSTSKAKVKSGISEVNATSTSASISSCKITDANTVTIKAKAGNVVKSSDSYYYLFSVPSTKTNLKNLQPIGTSEKNTSFTFTASLDKDGANSLLNSKFVIAIKQKSSYKIISAFHFITNPEAVATYTYEFPTAPTKKGLQGFSSSLGVNHTVINIEVNDMIATPSEYGSKSTVAYTYKGNTYYFRKDEVRNYASTAKYFSDKGAVVYAILLMSWSSKPELITPKGRQYGYAYYAWNMKDQNVKEQLEALMTYFADYCCSYCGDGPGIAGWIVGNEVDNFDTWNYAGTSDFDAYARIYADTFRLVYNATKSVYSNARVYISLDHMWAMSNEGTFGSKAFLEKFNSILDSEGNIDWDIAYHPYPVPLTEPDFWKNEFISNNENSDVINMKNLNVLTNYVKKHYGKDKRIILSELGFTSASGEKLQAAAIAYAYYIAEFNPMVDAFIMRSLADADVEVEQGLSFGITGKRAYDVYKYMDTPQSENYTKFALKVIGAKKWKSIVPKYNANKFSTMPNR